MNLCNCDAKVSVSQCEYGKKLSTSGPGAQLATVTVPMQPWETPYESSKALKQGTIFPCLDLPSLIVGGEKSA